MRRLSAGSGIAEFLYGAMGSLVKSFLASGKLDTRGLPAPEYTGDDYRAPDSPVEEILAAIYAEILGLEPADVSVDDSFFELGGDSIVSIQLVNRARRLGLQLTPQQVFTALKEMQRPRLVSRAGNLSQCLFHPSQLRGFVIQYCDTHGRGPSYKNTRA